MLASKYFSTLTITAIAAILILPAKADTITRKVDQSGTPVITIKGQRPPAVLKQDEVKTPAPRQDTRKEYRVYELKPLPVEPSTTTSSEPVAIPAPPAIAPSPAAYNYGYGYPYTGYGYAYPGYGYYGYSYWGYGFPYSRRWGYINHRHVQPPTRLPSNYQNRPVNYQNPPINYENRPVNYQNRPVNYQNPPVKY